jgi:hypothetical protein
MTESGFKIAIFGAGYVSIIDWDFYVINDPFQNFRDLHRSPASTPVKDKRLCYI